MNIMMGIVYYVIIAWLILKGPDHFNRSEIKKTYQPRDDESVHTPQEVIKMYEAGNMNKAMAYQLIDQQTFMVFHKMLDKEPLLVYEMANGFFNRHSISNVAHTLKIIGYCHIIFTPHGLEKGTPQSMIRMGPALFRNKMTKSVFLGITRRMFVFLSLFTVIAAILVGDLMFALEFLPFVLILTLISYTVYILREVWLYIRQNRFSLKTAGEMGFDMDDADYLRRYLRKSLFRFIVLQFILTIFMFVLTLWMLVAFNAS